jgi:hypothetical protein
MTENTAVGCVALLGVSRTPGSNLMILAIAMNQIGQVPPHVPKDEDGLRIHHSVAEVLNAKAAAEMRSGFTCELMKLRGVFTFTGGKAERELQQATVKRRSRWESVVIPFLPPQCGNLLNTMSATPSAKQPEIRLKTEGMAENIGLYLIGKFPPIA